MAPEIRRLTAMYLLFVILLFTVATEEMDLPSTVSSSRLIRKTGTEEVLLTAGTVLRDLDFIPKSAASLIPWRISPRDYGGEETDWLLTRDVRNAREALRTARDELEAAVGESGGRFLGESWARRSGLLFLTLEIAPGVGIPPALLRLWAEDSGAPVWQVSRQPRRPQPEPSLEPKPKPTSTPEGETEIESPVPPSSPPSPQPRPRAAIILDDVGVTSGTENFIALPAQLTFAVLPFTRYAELYARQAEEAGRTVILHLPMESLNGDNPGPGAIYTGWSREEVEAQLLADLAAVPGAVGINNHMGSLGTSDEQLMRHVISVIRDEGLFFLDSLTWKGSVGAKVAHLLGVKHATRDLFLDPTDASVEEIQELLRRLIALAERRGGAIGICHANRPNTLAALSAILPEFAEAGVDIVPVTELLIAEAPEEGNPDKAN